MGLTIVVTVWLAAACLLAAVASASRMSFFAWLLIGVAAPALILVLAAEYSVAALSLRGQRALPLEG